MFAITPRLTLRPGWPEDAPALARAIGQRPVAEHLTSVPWPYRLADAEAFLASPRAPTDLFLLICSREDDRRPLIGGIGLRPDGDAHALGYWLTPEVWGRGYMTEAARAMLAAARGSLRLSRFRAGHFVDNPASGRVLAKLGFRPTGRTERQPCPARGGEIETALLELDLDEHRAMPLAA